MLYYYISNWVRNPVKRIHDTYVELETDKIFCERIIYYEL